MCPIVFQCLPSNFRVTRDKKIAHFDPIWALPDCKSSLNSPMALKWCTKLDVVYKRCHVVEVIHQTQGHSGWKIDDLNPIRVKLLGRSQLSNPSDLPCFDLNINLVFHYHAHHKMGVNNIVFFTHNLCLSLMAKIYAYLYIYIAQMKPMI